MSPPTVRHLPPVARIVLDDARMNLFTFDTVRQLREACLPVLDDPAIRVIVLETGLRHVWSAGADLSEFADPERTFDGIAGWYYDVYDLAHRFLTSDKVVVASLSRSVVGVAAALVLSCDFRVFSTKANLFLPEARLGLVAPLFSADFLAAYAGLEHTKRLLIECPKLTGAEAKAMGLATHVFEFETFQPQADRFVADLAKRDPLPVSIIKRHLAHRVGFEPLGPSREDFIRAARSAVSGHWRDFLAALRGPAASEGIRQHLAAHP